MRSEKSNIKVPVAVWMLNHTKGEGGGRQTRRFRNVELLSMVSFTVPEQSVVLINDTVPTLTGPGGQLDTELKKA